MALLLAPGFLLYLALITGGVGRDLQMDPVFTTTTSYAAHRTRDVNPPECTNALLTEGLEDWLAMHVFFNALVNNGIPMGEVARRGSELVRQRVIGQSTEVNIMGRPQLVETNAMEWKSKPCRPVAGHEDAIQPAVRLLRDQSLLVTHVSAETNECGVYTQRMAYFEHDRPPKECRGKTVTVHVLLRFGDKADKG